MNPRLPLSAAVLAMGLGALSACGQAPSRDEAEAPAAATAAEAAADAAADAAAAPSPAAQPAAQGAPAFAVLYPGGQLSGPATTAMGPAGPGGMAIFTTPATPDQVVAFYRERAEAAGLSSVANMNQGDSRGYSAGDGFSGRGKLLNVVATPVPGGGTSVQIDWSAGR